MGGRKGGKSSLYESGSMVCLSVRVPPHVRDLIEEEVSNSYASRGEFFRELFRKHFKLNDKME